jgi:hypothetical protein
MDINTISEYNYHAVILYLSNFSLITKIYHYLLLNKIVIVNNNSISRQIIKNKQFLYNDFNNINENLDYIMDDNFKNDFIIKINKKKVKKLLDRFKFIETGEKIYYDKLENITYHANNPISIKEQEQFHKKITPLMINIEEKFKNKVLNVDKFYRFLKNTDNKTENCYATIIFINNTYLPGILVTGFKLKSITKLNIVCFVQDKPYYENNILKFPGLNSRDIEKIKKIYDVVIGIDVITEHINKNTTHYVDTERSLNPNYKNIFYYCNKIICSSFTYYKKILYLDASVFITKDIPEMFNNEKSKYSQDIPGSIIFIITKNYYIYKLLYLLENYNQIFKTFIPKVVSFDEFLYFYTIFPNWGDRIDMNLIGFNTKKVRYDRYKGFKTYPIMMCEITKPFRYTQGIFETERNKFTQNFMLNELWDTVAAEIIIQYPELKRVFYFINTFRYITIS